MEVDSCWKLANWGDGGRFENHACDLVLLILSWCSRERIAGKDAVIYYIIEAEPKWPSSSES
jgi:hypothetical protein